MAKIRGLGSIRITLAVLACGVLVPAGAQTLRVAASETLRPYEGVITQVLRDAKFDPQMRFYPPERSFFLLARGDVDVEAVRTWSAIEPIKEMVRLIGPVGCVEVGLFVRAKDPPSIANFRDLANRKVGVALGSRLAQQRLRDHGVQFEVISTREGLFRMLEAGRIDAAFEAHLEAFPVLNQLSLGDSIVLKPALLDFEPTYLVLRHNFDEWGPRLQQQIEAQIRSGRWQQLVGAANQAIGLPRDVGLSCLKHAP